MCVVYKLVGNLNCMHSMTIFFVKSLTNVNCVFLIFKLFNYLKII